MSYSSSLQNQNISGNYSRQMSGTCEAKRSSQDSFPEITCKISSK